MPKGASVKQTKQKLAVRLPNGFELDFRLRDGVLLGLAGVRFQGRDLRHPGYLLAVFLEH